VNRRVIESLIKCGAFDFSGAHRSQMLIVLEEILERSQGAQRKRDATQMSMWEGSPGEREGFYPEIDEYPESQLILFEKETIGFYISRHPLSAYQEAIKRHTEEDTSTLPRLQNGQEVKICGLVSSLKEIVTKKGDRMAFLSLEDMKGFVEVILFPEVFKSASNCLRGGDPLLVRGSLDLSEDRIKIKATEVRSLAGLSSSPLRSFHLKIPHSSLTPTGLAQLKETILAHQGSCRVFLHITNGEQRETVIAFSDEYRVDPSPVFQNRVKTLFSSPRVSFEWG
jgi:DNA polymerase-3 subunit alpha